jgi:hypothetical protein
LIPLKLILNGKFRGFCVGSAWVWPPDDAQQIAEEPVSCDSSVNMGEPFQGSHVE